MSYTRLFFALVAGSPGGTEHPQTAHPQTVHALGILHVPSGRLEASDPFVSLGDGLVTEIAAGSYPVFVTVADVSDAHDRSHEREAYLSLVVSDAAPVAEVRPVTAEGAEPMEHDEFYGVGVDAGTVAFADAAAIASGMPAEDGDDSWDDDVFDSGTPESWFSIMDSADHYRAGCANIVLPLAGGGENVVLSHSGWGDGFYPVVSTHAADGSLLGVHIDLLVAEPATA